MDIDHILDWQPPEVSPTPKHSNSLWSLETMREVSKQRCPWKPLTPQGLFYKSNENPCVKSSIIGWA